MDVIYGYDTGIMERTLTLHFTESEVNEFFQFGEKYMRTMDALHTFHVNPPATLVSVDGENGDVLIRNKDGENDDGRQTS